MQWRLFANHNIKWNKEKINRGRKATVEHDQWSRSKHHHHHPHPHHLD